MGAFEFILLALATWRLSWMLAYETGPGAVFDRLRFAVGASPSNCIQQQTTDTISNIFCCIKCLSVWVAIALFAALVYAPVIVWVLAASACAVLIQKVVSL